MHTLTTSITCYEFDSQCIPHRISPASMYGNHIANVATLTTYRLHHRNRCMGQKTAKSFALTMKVVSLHDQNRILAISHMWSRLRQQWRNHFYGPSKQLFSCCGLYCDHESLFITLPQFSDAANILHCCLDYAI